MWFWFVCFYKRCCLILWWYEWLLIQLSVFVWYLPVFTCYHEMDYEKARKQEAVSSLYDNSSSQDSKDSEGLPLLKKESV